MALSAEDRKMLMELKYDDISFTFIENTFVNKFDPKTKKIIPPRISFQEELDLQPGEHGVTEKTHTNVGQIVVNVALYGNTPNIKKALGFVAKPYSKGTIEDTEAQIISEILNKKIEPDEFAKYLNNIQWFGNTFAAHTTASFTPNTTKILPSVKKERDRLFKKHAEELKGPNGAVVAANISDKVLEIAKKELKGDVGMDVYDSGAKPKFGAAYRAMFVSHGPEYNSAKQQFDISKNSFVESMEKEDVPVYGNQVINGSYPKAVGTSIAGYETKKLFACYQAMKAGPVGSDCGSKSYRTVRVTKKNKKSILKRYYLNGNKLEVLEDETLDKLIGKDIKIRSPLYCTASNGYICNKCLGEMPYIIGIENVGLTSSSVGSGLLNLLMKSFHDTTVKTYHIDIDRLYHE